MSAIVNVAGVVRQLDRPAEPNRQVTTEEVQKPEILARLLMNLLRDVALLKRRFFPHRIEHEDRDVDATGTVKHRFPHNFAGRVRWWVVDWQGAAAPALSRDDDTDDNTLVLVSLSEGTVTLRIEEAG